MEEIEAIEIKEAIDVVLDPEEVEEVKRKEILEKQSCPTCGRLVSSLFSKEYMYEEYGIEMKSCIFCMRETQGKFSHISMGR
mgnify:CR=1 FL=1